MRSDAVALGENRSVESPQVWQLSVSSHEMGFARELVVMLMVSTSEADGTGDAFILIQRMWWLTEKRRPVFSHC